MRCLTVRQPWAWAIAYAGKDVENRTGGVARWARAEGTTIGIHAGSAWSERGQKDRRVRGAWWQYRGITGKDFDGGPSLPRPERVAGHLMPIDALRERPIWFGCVIALAEVGPVHTAGACRGGCSPWAETAYREADGRIRTDVVHLPLLGVDPLDDPMPATGRLGLWEPEADLKVELLMRALETSVARAKAVG